MDIEADRVKLTADGVVQLFKIDLRNGSTLRLKNDNTASWQSQTWEGIALMMQGVKRSANEELSRPTLAIANKDHIFSQYVNQGILEKSVVTRYRVLKTNFDSNINLFEQATWYIARVVGVTNANVTVELRNPIDGPTVLTPARMYLPPEFPAVSLTG